MGTRLINPVPRIKHPVSNPGGIQMIQSVERALDILNAVAQEVGWVGVREIARRTNMKVPTVQQLLKTLQNKAYLEFDPAQRKYRVGVAATLLARGADPTTRLGDFIQPFVDQLHKQFGETFVAMMYHGGTFTSIACRPSIHQLTVTPPARGQVVEQPQVMASGRLLLAFLPEEIQRRFAKDAATRALLPAIREAALAEVQNVNGSGIAALAVPVWKRDGREGTLSLERERADTSSKNESRERAPSGTPPLPAFAPLTSALSRVGERVQPLLALACSMPVQRWTPEVRQRVLDALLQTATKAERALP
jgi:DNA-binding IclR family transcriptional regulator